MGLSPFQTQLQGCILAALKRAGVDLSLVASCTTARWGTTQACGRLRKRGCTSSPSCAMAPRFTSPMPAYKCRFFSPSASRPANCQSRAIDFRQTRPSLRSSGFDGQKLMVKQGRDDQRPAALENADQPPAFPAPPHRSGNRGGCLLYTSPSPRD